MSKFLIQAVLSESEEWSTHERLELLSDDFAEIFGEDAETTLVVETRGLGANWEVIVAAISISISAVGGVPGLLDLGSRLKQLKSRWKSRSGGTTLFPINVVLPMVLEGILTEEQIKRIVYVNASEIGMGPAGSRLGDFPAIYVYVIYFEQDDYRSGKLLLLVTKDTGDIIQCTFMDESLLYSYYRGKDALLDFLKGQ